MSTILRDNNNVIWRWNNQILRSPIVMTLLPDQKKIYQIGDPRSLGSDGYLHNGFRYNGTSRTAVVTVGRNLVNQMINGTPRWLDASGPHDPEFVWYQGAYSTSNNYISYGKNQSEAYAALAGWHFTIPSQYRGHVKFVTVDFLNMGAVWAYGVARWGNRANKNINQADYGWYGWNQPIFVLNTPTCNYHQLYINNNFPYDSVDITQYGSQGSFMGSRNLWAIGDTSDKDGYIPTLTNPVRQTYNLGSTTFQSFIKNNGGWILPSIIPVEGYDDYLPRCGWSESETPSTNNYWACISLRDVVVHIGLDIGET